MIIDISFQRVLDVGSSVIVLVSTQVEQEKGMSSSIVTMFFLFGGDCVLNDLWSNFVLERSSSIKDSLSGFYQHMFDWLANNLEHLSQTVEEEWDL